MTIYLGAQKRLRTCTEVIDMPNVKDKVPAAPDAADGGTAAMRSSPQPCGKRAAGKKGRRGAQGRAPPAAKRAAVQAPTQALKPAAKPAPQGPTACGATGAKEVSQESASSARVDTILNLAVLSC